MLYESTLLTGRIVSGVSRYRPNFRLIWFQLGADKICCKGR